MAPLEKLRFEIFQTFSFYWRHYFHLVGIVESRDRLFAEKSSLEAECLRLHEFENENKRLRSLLNFPDEPEVRQVAATVIGRNSSNYTRSVTINRGSSDGLKPGNPVFDGNAIVGQVIACSDHAAIVLLLTDNTSAIDALVQEGRAPGVVEGTMGEHLIMRYVNNDYTVRMGDRVISSGLDGIYPKGRLIGSIVKVEEGKTGMFKQIEVDSSVDFARLENVLVLLTAGRKEVDDLEKIN
ncbi:MAG: rod shape-determining protein MreC [Deltaproteobacteria bacterium]|nr:rod shape-determining protein MreC [Deltaproteobacteria bacterium]